MCFFITNLFGVVAAAIQGNVDCEDKVSHLPTPIRTLSQPVNYRPTPGSRQFEKHEAADQLAKYRHETNYHAGPFFKVVGEISC